VYQSRLEAARALNEAVENALADQIAIFREKRMAENLYTAGRKEVLD
jgi:hypothetical protein